ncbi:MAG: arginine repressor [Planctomycetota bacterium]|jgi:transcriptional regulator of arginine metabolism
MSPPTPTKAQRRRTIVQLIRSYTIKSQAELLELLEEDGVVVNQGTLSRDLRDLGVVKGREGYALPGTGTPPTSPNGLGQAVRQWLIEAIPVHNQVLLKTPIGGAAPLALAVDGAELGAVVGTIAGDDTVLVICKSAGKAKTLARQFEEMAS